MRDVVNIMTTMLMLVALFLLVDNAGGTASILKAFGETWFNGMKVLQGR